MTMIGFAFWYASPLPLTWPFVVPAVSFVERVCSPRAHFGFGLLSLYVGVCRPVYLRFSGVSRC